MNSRKDTIKSRTSVGAERAVDDAGGGHSDAALAVEYKKFFQAVASSPSSVVITNADGVIEYVNDRFVESTGYQRDQAVGRKPNLLKSGKTPTRVYEDLWATITAGKIWRGEMCNRRRNGEHYWEATAIAPILDDNGKPSHFVAVKDDITARREAEERLLVRQERDAVLGKITRALLGAVTDAALGAALSELGVYLSVDRAFLFRLSSDGLFIANSHEWLADGVASHRENFEGLGCEQFAWCLDQCRRGKTLAVGDVHNLPAAADTFKALLLKGGIHASMTVPIMQAGQLLGFVGVDVEQRPRDWSEGDIAVTERVATVLGLALLRLDAENELRTARDQAHHAEQNLRDAIECLPEGFVLYDAQGHLEICNSRFRQDYGYSEDDVRPGMHFADLGRLDIARGRVTIPAGYPNADSYLQSRLAYRTKTEGTFPVQLVDGRHLMTRDRRTTSGGIVSIQTDITRIKKIEEALRISERKFWGVFHASPSLMSISGLADGRFLDINARWSSAMGFDYTEVIGRTASELGIWPSMQAQKRMVRAFTAEGILTNFEGQLKSRAGELRDYLMSGALVSIDGAEHLLLLCNDITERKSMERALKRSEMEMLKAKEEAESANLAKSNFLSGMSHELRTPLNAVIGFSQMMELQQGAVLTDQQREYLGFIRSSGEHLLTLINEVLDLAKVEAGRMDLRVAPVEVAGLISDCIALVKPLAVEHHIGIEWQVPENLPHILVDRTKFKQILINLLSNAVKYNVEGGSVTVTFSRAQKDFVAIAVTDTGQGMSPANCDALFEPFQRLGAEHSGIEGTGLGLVLAKRMIETMGGTIRVASAPGLGSTFTLAVPTAVR